MFPTMSTGTGFKLPRSTAAAPTAPSYPHHYAAYAPSAATAPPLYAPQYAPFPSLHAPQTSYSAAAPPMRAPQYAMSAPPAAPAPLMLDPQPSLFATAPPTNPPQYMYALRSHQSAPAATVAPPAATAPPSSAAAAPTVDLAQPRTRGARTVSADVVRARTASAATTAQANALSAQSPLGLMLSQVTSPDQFEDVNLGSVALFLEGVRESHAVVAASAAESSVSELNDRAILRTLHPDIRNLSRAIAIDVAAKKEKRRKAKAEAEEAKRLADNEMRAAARRNKRQQPSTTVKKSNNSDRCLFSLSVISMFERRYLIDAIDAVKAKGVHTGLDSDEKAGAEVHRRLVVQDPVYARKLTPQGKKWYTKARICNWRKQIPCDIQRNNAIAFVRQNPASAPTPSFAPLELVIVKYLVALADRKLLFSIATACNWIDNCAEFRGVAASLRVPNYRLPRSVCRSLMKKCGLAPCAFVVEELTPEDLLSAKRRVCIELAIVTMGPNGVINDAVIYNLDETSLRLFPEHTKSWCFANDFRRAGFRATKAYTTVLCGMSASGDFLPAQVNWKGSTDGCLAFKGDQSRRPELWTSVCQTKGDSHWTTTDSLMLYIETVIVPHWIENRKDADTKFVVTLDYAPAHKSYETRKAFYEQFGSRGYLIFVPRRCTNTLQPLDIGSFGEFKPKVLQQQTALVVSGSMEHLLVAWGSSKVKELVMDSVAHGVEHMRKAYGGVRRKGFVERCWTPLFMFKDPASQVEAARFRAMSDDQKTAYCLANGIFEYGLPDKPPLEKSLKFTKAGDANAEEIFFEIDRKDIPDAAQDEEGLTHRDEEKYYGSISDTEENTKK